MRRDKGKPENSGRAEKTSSPLKHTPYVQDENQPFEPGDEQEEEG